MPTRYAFLSLCVALVVLALKLIAARVSGSLALWSEALETIVNVVTAILTLLALHYSAKPADKNHPYGHAKIEYIVATLQGVFIFLTAVLIFKAGFSALQAPKLPIYSHFALIVTILATLLNVALGVFLNNKGKEISSPALQAEGKHVLSDVYTSIGVIIGFILTHITQNPILDPIIALIVACFILISGFRLMKVSFGALMDEAVDPKDFETILTLINTHKQEAIEVHDIRHRRVASQIFIECHLVVNGAMTVERAHEICDIIEAALVQKYTNALINIHVEPEFKAKFHK